jgi:penicillin-binding protein A
MLREKRSSRRIALLLCGLTLASTTIAGAARGRRQALAAPRLLIAGRDPESPRRPLEITLDKVRAGGKGYVAELPDGGKADLTLDPRLQRLADRLLLEHGAPYGSAVLVSVEDGRVLALTPWAPAASVFKVVTSAALVQAGVEPGEEVCYHEGSHSVEASNLSPSRLDRQCNSFAYGLAHSQNAIIARLAHDHLQPAALDHTARALGFGAALPFEVPVAPSAVEVPSGGLAFARVAAGFWQTSLSPMHGAWLAATIGRGGVTPPLRIVERVVQNGEVLRPAPATPRRVLDEATARKVARMMVGTTRSGTAKLGFHDKRGNEYLPGIDVAGKTGSLNRKEGPFLAYSWFVGFAPADRPEVAVAVALGNGSGREAKAHRLARELLEGYFRGKPAMVASR